ncbi:MAG TPA: stage II sporulation protein M [Myxococcales bacterium]|nr:stage II sporulation protein M [Myxococcales bacterium]
MTALARFIEERRPRWNRLETLLEEAQESETRLGPERLQELVLLYRSACTDLNRARTLTANPELIGGLNQLIGRAYRIVYRRRRSGRIDLKRFFLREVPATFHRRSRWFSLAAAALLAGAAVGFAAVIVNPAYAAALIPGQFFVERPAARVEHAEKGNERIESLRDATAFGAYLYTHNIQVSFLTFALGALSFAGGIVLLFYNGLILGAVAAQYLIDGAGTFFVAWVGPHGALEIPAIVFAGAAGLLSGNALLMPGETGRVAALRDAFPAVFRILCACAVLLVCAGLIEGSFSQMSARSVPYAVKIAVAAALFAAMCTWLFGRRDEGA